MVKSNYLRFFQRGQQQYDLVRRGIGVDVDVDVGVGVVVGGVAQGLKIIIQNVSIIVQLRNCSTCTTGIRIWATAKHDASSSQQYK
jgi:hypothetical protein